MQKSAWFLTHTVRSSLHQPSWRLSLLNSAPNGHGRRRSLQAIVLVGLWWTLMTPDTWAAVGTDEGTSARSAIIVLTIIVALLVGALLYQYAQRSSQTRFKGQGARPPSQPVDATTDSDTLMPAILVELNRLQAPAQERHHVARSVAEIVSKTLDEQVGRVKRGLDARYSQLIEERRRAESMLQHKYQEVLQEKKQTTSVLESIAEGLVVVNAQGEVVMMNPAAEKLLAVNQKDRIGKPLLEDLREGQLVSLVRGSNEDRDIVLNAKHDSTKRILRASNAVITDEDGKAVGMVTVLSDVTKEREIEQLKSEFVSKVSHELRTPVVAMQHALSILSDGVAGPISEEQQKFVSLSQRNLERLNGLLNDLLDLSKLEAKKMELRLETTSITELIRSVCESLNAWATSKAIAMTQRVPGDLPVVVCDQARVMQVLTNLLGNAIKWTPKQGHITVEAKARSEGHAIEVSVTDTGLGISQEDLPKLFHKFQQVGDRTATDMTGTGLGLAIAKEIVELHHGRIWAESDAMRKGARFAFELPIVPPSTPKKEKVD